MSSTSNGRWTLFVTVVLPGWAAIVLLINSVWDFPHQDAVAMVLLTINVLLGIWLRSSSEKHKTSAEPSYDGYLGYNGSHPDTGIPNLKMVITTLPDELLAKEYATLKIGSPPRQED